MQLVFVITAFVLVLFPAWGTTNGIGRTRTLTLSECIQLALSNNFEVRIETLNTQIAKQRLEEAKGAYDPKWQASGGRAYDQAPGGVDDQNRPFPGATTDRDTLRAGIGGVLPVGLSYDLGTDLNRAAGNNFDGTFENTQGDSSIQLRQPLLRNAWIDAPRLAVRLGRRDARISQNVMIASIMNTVTATETAYYDLLLARENVSVQEQALKLALDLVEANRERVRQGVMARLDEKQSESLVAMQRSFLLASQRNLRAQENVLKGLITDRIAEWMDVSPTPVGELAAQPVILDRRASGRHALEHRPDLSQAREEFSRTGDLVSFSKNQLWPQLDAVGAYGQGGSAREYNRALGQIGSGSSPFYSYGLQLTVPFQRRAEKSRAKIAEIQRQQAELRLQQLEQEALIQVDNALQWVATNWERVTTTREGREFAEAALEAEQAKLENGRSSSFFVLQLQRDRTAARLNEVEALADYNKSVAQLALREGRTLERHSIQLSKP